MKRNNSSQRGRIIWQALQAGSILSLLIYGILRTLFFEFPMTWTSEGLFFLKTFLSSVFIIAAATGGSTWLYLSVIRMRRG